MGVKDYSLNADDNTQINGINIAEGCPPSGINNAIRQLMADVKEMDDDLNKTATEDTAGPVIPQTGDEDGLELEKDGKLRVRKASDTQRGSVLASVTAAANAVPQAGKDGTLDESWTANCLQLSGGTLTGAVAESLAKVTGEAVTLDLKTANNFTHNVTANTAFTVTANTGNSFQLGTLVLTNGGAFTVTWPSSFKWADGAPPSLMESGIDVITFFTINGGTTYYAAQAMTGIE